MLNSYSNLFSCRWVHLPSNPFQKSWKKVLETVNVNTALCRTTAVNQQQSHVQHTSAPVQLLQEAMTSCRVPQSPDRQHCCEQQQPKGSKFLGLSYSAYMWQDFKHEKKMFVCFYAQCLPVKAAVTIPCRATSWEQPVKWTVTCTPPHLFNISLSGVSCAPKPSETNKSQKAHRGYPSFWMQNISFLHPQFLK